MVSLKTIVGVLPVIMMGNPSETPALEDIRMFVQNPAFDAFLADLSAQYCVEPHLEFSKCNFAYGWNLKYKKSGKALCTVYPHEGFFTVLVVVGQREKAAVLEKMETFCPEIQAIYRETREGLGQKWLMIRLDDCGTQYQDVLRLIAIRMQKRT